VNTLLRHVRCVRRRLIAQRFLDLLVWCWFATLAAALIAIVVGRFWPLGLEAWIWGAGAIALGLLVAAVWTLGSRSSRLDAAIELDRRFALKERVSSALALTPAEQTAEAGEALLADAVRSVERIDVRGRFGVKTSRRWLLPMLPGILALLVALLIAPAVVENPTDAKAEEAAVSEQVKKSTEAVRRQLADRRQEAKKKGLQEAERLLLKLEEGVKEAKKEPNKEKALTKLNDLSRKLADRRKELGNSDSVKEQLGQFKDVNGSRVDKCEKALGRGDLKKAADELDKLKDDLNDSKLTAAEKENLAEQIAECQSKLQRDRDEMKTLEDAEKDLVDAKDRMNCKHCNGDGCDECQGGQGQACGDGEEDGPGNQQETEQIAAGGLKAGMAIVRGLRTKSEKDIKAKLYDSQVKQRVGHGSATVVGTVGGPNAKGDYRQEIQKQVESVRQGSTDPLVGRQMPRKHGEHAREYFDGLREGKE
jgi:hypothetical protein